MGPIHIAASKGDKRLVKLLIDHGVDVNKKNTNGSTALHFAAENGFIEIVEMLLKDGKADLNETDFMKFTALHFAASGGFLDVVKFLIKQPLIQIHAENTAGVLIFLLL